MTSSAERGIISKVNSLLKGPLVLVDIETDGMNPSRGHILEVAVIRVEDGVIVDEFQSLINPGGEVPPYITRLTGITTAHIANAPQFVDVSDRLLEIMSGALFVAHNVRFDYSFLKQEFQTIGVDFAPRQLCTVKLSRRLYPEQKSHKLASLIERHNFTYSARHRAYDDALVLWQFLQHVSTVFDQAELEIAIKLQFRHPSVPKHLDRQLIASLPAGPGVYIFHDETGAPLYVGKSINIRQRVMSHFTKDTTEYREFKITQMIHDVTYESTGGELEALLRESQLIKQLQPLYNRRLRRVHKLVSVIRQIGEDGYVHLAQETLDVVSPDQFDIIMALYDKRSTAKSSLLTAIQTFDLCPKLCGLEKSKGACFSYHLNKCRGACIGKESPTAYNRRLELAFDHKRIKEWPYDGPIIVSEPTVAEQTNYNGFIVDQWCIVGTVRQDQDYEPDVKRYQGSFDNDAYKILKSFLTSRSSKLKIMPLRQLNEI
jgi:DNA polymerase-3 subunit epsilon